MQAKTRTGREDRSISCVYPPENLLFYGDRAVSLAFAVMPSPIQSVYSGLFSWLKNRFPETADKLPAYAELIRLDKPIGILLLLWPTIGALWIASEGFPGFYLFFIFLRKSK